ncbi:plasma-membrane choline transporter-domain-containing protein [Cokeromyces recurvatus]|uniref:plasma-membrane choline transporter-domain-containing protein n=1 Tax=Cokeromyces recurvatus TaxID=90255 RepID=UPI00221E5EC9|nr:plasma-membrane choline transporter-domain-containing protein [Cokeromyces recurvatus]KAI7900418.1 plasma-membrane choline transporter-domain-containing protein [Cokeromyces recurvatus]
MEQTNTYPQADTNIHYPPPPLNEQTTYPMNDTNRYYPPPPENQQTMYPAHDSHQHYPPPPVNQTTYPTTSDNNRYYPPPPNEPYNTNQTDQTHHPEYHGQPYGQSYDHQKPPLYNIPPTQTYNNENGGETGEKGIKQASGWRDIWAILLWLCNLGAFIGLAVVALRTYRSHSGSYHGVQSENAYPGLTFDTTTFKIFGLSAIVGFGISFLYLIFANLFPKPLIVVTFIGSIIVYFGVTIYYFVMHYYSAAIVFLIFACLYVACFFWWKSRIPFATVMLQTITSITRKYPSTIVIGFISLIIQTAFNFLFMFTVIGIYQAWYSSSSNNSKLNCAMVFLVFSFYWTSQVISYVTHVTLAGIFATVYFLNDGVRHPIWGSLKRALTTSFGSICFGALLIAFVNLIRYFLQIARSNTDNACTAFFICIIQCIVNCAAGLFEWFNYYAFSGVAIYGQAFIPSARRTWTMIKDRGIEAMINDNLIGNVLFMGGLLVGILCSLLGFIYLEVAKPTFNQAGNMTPVVIMMCFLIGASMFSTIATVISSGVATTFVCLAEDPEALRRTKPELYEKIRQTWPRIAQSV